MALVFSKRPLKEDSEASNGRSDDGADGRDRSTRYLETTGDE